MSKPETYYYSDEVNDDFANTNIKNHSLPENYKFINDNIFGRLGRFLIARVIVMPIIFFYVKVILRIKYVNKKAMKPYKNRACFIYGNHTSFVRDAFNPLYLAYPRAVNVIVNADASNIKGLRGLIRALGGVPIPAGFSAMKKFNAALETLISRKRWIAIYPEAHIWPYYTKIRPFPNVSFSYPVKLDCPVFSYTTVYKKRKHFKKPKIEIYIDGPFFPDKELTAKQSAAKLRDEVYAAMLESAKNSNCEYIKYVYRPKEEK